MTPYRLSRDAERDLVQIATYVAEKASLEIAESLLTRIIETIILLAKHPQMGRPAEQAGKSILAFPSEQFKIYYQKRRNGIVVVHVFHGSRDQMKAWKTTNRTSS